MAEAINDGQYITGVFPDSVFYGLDTLRTSETDAVYHIRLSAELEPIWFRRIAENRVTEGTYHMTVSTAPDGVGGCIVGMSFTDELFLFEQTIGDTGGMGIELIRLNEQCDTVWTRTVQGDKLGGKGITTNSLGEIFITGQDSGDVFIAKYSSAGDFLWRRTAGTPSGFDQGYAIEVDAFSNVYVVGILAPPGVANFDGLVVPLASGAFNVSFVAKYNSFGTVQWVRYVYSALWAEGTFFTALCCPPSGGVVLVGNYEDAVLRFSNGLSPVGSRPAGSPVSFLVAFDDFGERIWVTTDDYSDQGYSRAQDIDKYGDSYAVLDQFYGNVTSTQGMISCYGWDDLRVRLYDSAGALEEDYQIGGSLIEVGGELHASNEGVVVLASTFSHPLHVGSDSFDHPDPGNAFVIKLAQEPNGLPSVAANQSFSAYPNPSNGEVRLSLDPRLGRCRVVVRDAMGRVVLERSVSGPTETMRIPESGLYLLELMGTDGRLEAQRLIVE
ncbi:MAG: hypothetical protein H6591_02065 [Flavobacteriales bacterium]|nr:hypothetical protein [Flavobacteriales bacterium]